MGFIKRHNQAIGRQEKNSSIIALLSPSKLASPALGWAQQAVVILLLSGPNFSAFLAFENN